MSLTVWAIDPGRVRRGQLDVESASMVLRDADVGTWTISAPFADPLVRRMVEGWRVLIYDDARALMSGPITGWDIDVAEDMIEMSGVSDMVHLEDRIIYPNPASDAESQRDDAYYKRTGLGGPIVNGMFHDSVATRALSNRRISGFAVGNADGMGVDTSTNLRYKPLLEEARAIARAGKFTFDVIQEPDSRIVARFREPVDRSRSVRFSKGNGGLTGGTISMTAPEVTSVLVAGQGQGADRTIKEHVQSSVWGRRIEQFQDRRDTDDPKELEAAGVDTLAEGAEGASATLEVTESPGRIFGVDFQMGDTLTVEFGNVTVSEPLREVELTWDGHGRDATLKLGDTADDADRDAKVVKAIRKLNKRMRQQESAL